MPRSVRWMCWEFQWVKSASKWQLLGGPFCLGYHHKPGIGSTNQGWKGIQHVPHPSNESNGNLAWSVRRLGWFPASCVFLCGQNGWEYLKHGAFKVWQVSSRISCISCICVMLMDGGQILHHLMFRAFISWFTGFMLTCFKNPNDPKITTTCARSCGNPQL